MAPGQETGPDCSPPTGRLTPFLASEQRRCTGGLTPVHVGCTCAGLGTAGGCPGSRERAVEAAARLPGSEAGRLLGDPVAAGDAITVLRRYSLVTPAGDGLVVAHRLVQAITRAPLSAEAADQWERAAATLVEAAIPADVGLPAAWRACALLLPHVRIVLDLTSGGMWQIARYRGHSGSYPRDLFQLIADAHMESDAYGPEHPHTLAARHSLAYWAAEAGDAAAAGDQLAALLLIRERVRGPRVPTMRYGRGGDAQQNTGRVADSSDAYSLTHVTVSSTSGWSSPSWFIRFQRAESARTKVS